MSSFGGSTQQMRLVYVVRGENRVIAANTAVARSADRVALANRRLGASAVSAAHKMSFMENQVRFTGRRMLFFGTLAALGAATAIEKMGFSYLNVKQQAEVSLKSVIPQQQALNAEINELFRLAAYTPFQFKDMASSFVTLYKPLRLLGFTVPQVNETILQLSNALSATPGKATASNMNRISTALQHMAYIGKPIGQTVLQLNRLGVPFTAALHKELNLTDEQIANIGRSGVTAAQAIDALNKFIKTTPGYMNQAYISQTKTLGGLWSTFKDLLSQASGSGGAVKGPFGFFQRTLKGVVDQFAATGGKLKPVTFVALAQAFDKQLTPKTHIVINTFRLLQGVIESIVGTIYAFITVVSNTINWLFFLTGVGRANEKVMRLMGWALGVLLVLWTVGKIRAIAFAVALDISKIAMYAGWIVMRLYVGTMVVMDFLMTVIRNRALIMATALTILEIAQSNLGKTTKKTTAMLMAESAALLTNPLFLLITAVVLLTVGLVVLYFKWKKFHDFINHTYHWLQDHPYAALLIPIYGQIIYAVVAAQKLYHWLKRIWDLLQKPFKLVLQIIKQGAGGGGGGVFGKIFGIATASNPALRIARIAMNPTDVRSYVPGGQFIPKAQHGGTVTRAGNVLVGEAGPEILNLPASAQIVPFSGASTTGGVNFGMPQVLNLKAILRVDGRDLAEVVANYRLDAMARR